ncbi:uncharacterized protein MAM_08274 [Metarhizium album ARSEF 1941]|uniref:Cystathionine beta-synthase, core n=1 Tax=Metarhizium album (strain ARSEF 1941) TaxID=1081103 RepID=A0A0B2WK58_METAS|nr:uncharacterized protein MAM_08274 [Metarhizium album ARSEF 1941]KHN93852.1 hypothetical protein MAM_08274 [Metarhizium album ARSEF 1941]
MRPRAQLTKSRLQNSTCPESRPTSQPRPTVSSALQQIIHSKVVASARPARTSFPRSNGCADRDRPRRRRPVRQILPVQMVLSVSRGTCPRPSISCSPPLLPPKPAADASSLAHARRQATVQDLEPPAALSLNPSDAISLALLSAFEREYTHLTVVDSQTRALLGYISIPHLQTLLDSGKVKPQDPVSSAMTHFQRRNRRYKVITLETPLEQLEEFFRGGQTDGPWREEFAVITDENRRFVLGVATAQDLEEFVRRRPA